MTTDKPTVDLNLDTFSKEADHQPFGIVAGGKPFSLTHAGALDAFELFDAMSAGEPTATLEVLRLALGDAKFAELKAARPKFAAMQKAVKDYFVHSGMASSGN